MVITVLSAKKAKIFCLFWFLFIVSFANGQNDSINNSNVQQHHQQLYKYNSINNRSVTNGESLKTPPAISKDKLASKSNINSKYETQSTVTSAIAIGLFPGSKKMRQRKCTERQFQCNNGECIPMKYLCDGEPDCQDKSDEDQTECSHKQNECSQDQFRCNNGRCIPKRWTCDQEKDCSDGSDEDASHCQQPSHCPNNEFLCHNGEQCIPRDWVCDNAIDCSDKSDEKSCVGKLLTV
ncbi:hypothetical protein PVAND_010916 [Polypedilum vanderplanki]|uniref:Uncharacterized protein n=1 Tax=Polypedilum vanderplanki TaxID=319348 RepID=A0A9J6CIT9_POLVA|nr:hypothetical protein PVAND_010916 [Polypedilum vanderplanki]